jgi:hypothetical protein
MLTVVLPDTSEVGLVRDLRWHFMWEDDIILLKNLGGKFAKSVPLFLELFTAFGSGCVNTENDGLLLIRVSERVKNSVSFTLIV